MPPLTSQKKARPLEVEKRGSLLVATWDFPEVFGGAGVDGTHRAVIDLPHGSAQLALVRVLRTNFTAFGANTVSLGVFANNPAGASPILAPSADNLYDLLWKEEAIISGISDPVQALRDQSDLGEVYVYTRGLTDSVVGRFFAVAEIIGAADLQIEIGFLPINRLAPVTATAVAAP